MDVSENNGAAKSSILIGFSIINHPFWGTPIFGNTHILVFSVGPRSVERCFTKRVFFFGPTFERKRRI